MDALKFILVAVASIIGVLVCVAGLIYGTKGSRKMGCFDLDKYRRSGQ